MLLGGLLIALKWLGIIAAIGFVAALVLFIGSPFLLSSRISREEEVEEYRLLLEKLRAAHRDHVVRP